MQRLLIHVTAAAHPCCNDDPPESFLEQVQPKSAPGKRICMIFVHHRTSWTPTTLVKLPDNTHADPLEFDRIWLQLDWPQDLFLEILTQHAIIPPKCLVNLLKPVSVVVAGAYLAQDVQYFSDDGTQPSVSLVRKNAENDP
jgi:hypothetical protein